MNPIDVYKAFLCRHLKLVELNSIRSAVMNNPDYLYQFHTRTDALGSLMLYKDEQDYLNYGIFKKINV